MATDMFLKITGIEGETNDEKHKGAIEVYSWSWGLSQSGSFATGGGGTSGKVNIHNMSFVKKMDKSSPELMLRCCNGKHISSAVLTVRKAAGETQLEYLKLTMTDIIVSGVSPSGSGGETTMESVSFDFAEVDVAYQEQDTKSGGAKGGPVLFGWNQKTNKKK